MVSRDFTSAVQARQQFDRADTRFQSASPLAVMALAPWC